MVGVSIAADGGGIDEEKEMVVVMKKRAKGADVESGRGG